MAAMQEIVGLAPSGSMGSGYNLEAFERGLAANPHFIGQDAGTTDTGPYYHGDDKPFLPLSAYRRDLEVMLDAARSVARYPVVGICEAALVTAGQLAKRIAVVTTLPRSIVPLEELVRRYGFAERAEVTACNVAVLDLEKPGSGAEEKLEAEISRALDKGAEAIVLGCAGMADLTLKLSRKFGVPVVDGVAAAVKQAEALAGLKLTTSRRGSYAQPAAKNYTGLLAPFAPKSSD